MKVNEEQPKLKATLKVIEMETDFKELQNEFEVLGNAYKLQETALKKLKAESETQSGLIQRLQTDLQLREHYQYRNKTTRQLAQEAFNQSTAKANWEGLGKHPVIEHIYEDIKNRSTDEGRRADDVLSRLENQMSVDEFFKQLGESSEIIEMRKFQGSLGMRIDSIETTLSYDRSHANKQDLKQRDKMSDFETALEALEFLGSEREITYGSAFMFLIGAWAQSGYEPVANGLREILKKPKVENVDGEKTEQTEKPSQ